MDNWGKANIISVVVSACVSLAILAIALWGIFFTSIPEEIIARLNSDISEAKNSLALAQQQKLQLNRHIETLLEKKQSVEEENKQLIDKNNDLSESFQKLNLKVKELSKNEKYRRQLYVKTSLSIFVESLRIELKKYKRNALWAASYSETLDWLKSQPDEGSDEVQEWLRQLPERGVSSFQPTFFDGFNELFSGKEYTRSKKLFKNFRMRIDDMVDKLDPDRKLLTGVTFIEKYLVKLKDMEKDEYTYKYIIDLFSSAINQTPDLKNNIEPVLLKSFNAEEIVRQGKEVYKTIITLENVIAHIEYEHQ